MIFVGVDWAEAHHDVHIEDEGDRRLGGGRLPEGVEGVARFHELVGAHVEEPARGGDRDRDGPGTVRRCAHRSRLPRLRGEPDVDVALSGSPLELGREI